MISDVLSDAVVSIKEYQREMPECYGSAKAEIDAVTAAMTALRVKLDAPPPVSVAPPKRARDHRPALTQAQRDLLA